MPDRLALPFFKEVLPGGITYGCFLIVESEPQSLWYEASFMLVVQALKTDMKSDYHTSQRKPDQVKDGLASLGLDVARTVNAS